MGIASEFAPAKLNLYLAVTGRRADGFHELVSVVVTLDWGDRLRAYPQEEPALECTDPSVPLGEENLIMKAARAYAAAGGRGSARFVLKKQIPMGAGLGGGSSDAVAALIALDRLSSKPLGPETLRRLAEGLGSDCPLFLAEGPVIMRGRGERLEPLPPAAAARLRGRRILVFKPAFGIPTAWAYAYLAARKDYVPPAEAEARLSQWIGDPDASAEALLFNSMERAAFAKFVALPALVDLLHVRHGLLARMSGSGSACFAFLDENQSIAPIEATVRDAWGPEAFVVETRVL